MSQKEYFGFGSIDNLKAILAHDKPRNIFLVTGKKSYEMCGAKKVLEELLSQYNVTIFNEFSWIPQIEDVKKGIKKLSENSCDMVVAVGGGSVLDVGKLINIFSNQVFQPSDYVFGLKKLLPNQRKLVAIPTTAGSGSEATHFAVVYVNNEKYSVAEKTMLPDYVVIDPAFTTSLSPYNTATSGMDAFCQAIESYWSRSATETSKKNAENAIRVILQNLANAVKSPDNESRLMMTKASNLAGKAINITKTTAPHAISYPLTSMFGILHGHAVSLTLSEFLVFNYNDTGSVKNTIQKLLNILGTSDIQDGRKTIAKLMNDIGLATRLSDFKIKESDLPIIIDKVNLERLANNPKNVTRKDLMKILTNIL